MVIRVDVERMVVVLWELEEVLVVTVWVEVGELPLLVCLELEDLVSILVRVESRTLKCKM